MDMVHFGTQQRHKFQFQQIKKSKMLNDFSNYFNIYFPSMIFSFVKKDISLNPIILSLTFI